MKNRLLMLVAVASGLLAQNHSAEAQLLINGDFEDDSAIIETGKVSNGFDEITGWQNIGTTASNSGVQYGTPGPGLNHSQSGNYFAYEDSDDGNGTNKGAYQITSTVLQAGDEVTLTWYAVNAFNAPVQNVDLLSASSQSSSFSSASILVPSNDPDLTLNATYTQYTLEYTATEADAGKYLGVSFATTGSTNSFAQYDHFVLTDVTEIPEPSTYTLLLAGFSGLLLAGLVRLRMGLPRIQLLKMT